MDKLLFLSECVSSIHPMSIWEFDRDCNLLQTNCPDERHPGSFVYTDLRALLKHFAFIYSRPSIVSGKFPIMWIIDSKPGTDGPDRLFAFGPFFMESFPEADMIQALKNEDLSTPERHRYLDRFRAITVISFMSALEYAVMFHYAITGEKISPYELHHETYSLPAFPEEHSDEDTQYHGTYEMEAKMLQMVREGDKAVFDYLNTLPFAAVGKLATDRSDALRQVKNMILVSIVLFSRAAIDGGLYPDTALTLTDRYFQALEASRDFQEMAEINGSMQQDFVNRVYEIRHKQCYSGSVQAVVEHLRLHLEDEIDLKMLAKEMGYTKYYLSRKFKQETGTTVKQFIRSERLEKAAYLLSNPRSSVKDVSERFHFSSQSYFIECFKEKYGVTPGQYQAGERNSQSLDSPPP